MNAAVSPAPEPTVFRPRFTEYLLVHCGLRSTRDLSRMSDADRNAIFAGFPAWRAGRGAATQARGGAQ
jgi:hypothetical protein